jgi:DNA-binding GntR family transcriptional regulator
MLPKANRRSLAQEAADLVRQAIFDGHFPPGAALREVELAASLDVSRGSVREGLGLLTREGLVTGGWHRGTTVIEVAATDVEEVYAVRGALDRLAATTAQRVASADQLKTLDDLVEAMAAKLKEARPAGQAQAGSGPGLLALDIAFHDRIYEIAANSRLDTAWQAIRSQTYLFQLRRVELSAGHYRARVVDEHRELVTLLRGTDREELGRRAEEHVESARRSLQAAEGL